MFDAPPADSPTPVPAFEIRGETGCPRPDEVVAALARVLGASGSSDVAELHDEPGAFVVVVRRASGELVGEKRVPDSLACAVRAEVAAVSIAALEGQLSGDDAPPLALPPAAPLPEPPPPAPPAPAAGSAASVVRTPSVPSLFGAELSASVLASFNGRDVAPAVRIEVALRRGASPWALGLVALATGLHGNAVGPGRAEWWRWGGEVSLLRGAQPWTGGRVEGRVGLALTALAVDGSSFPVTNGGDTLLEPGAVAGARFAPFAGWPWLEVVGALWPRRNELSVTDEGGNAVAGSVVPRGEVFVGIGATGR